MDADLRRLERAAATGDPEAVARLHQARRRAGALPQAGEYVRLDGRRIERPEVTGNWRVAAILVGGSEVTLAPVSANREVITLDVSRYVTISGEGLALARVPYDEAVTVADAAATHACVRCGALPGEACSAPSGTTRRRPHVIRGEVPALVPPPPPLPVRINSSRQRPSVVRVLESRNRNADLRITAADLAERRAARDIDTGLDGAI